MNTNQTVCIGIDRFKERLKMVTANVERDAYGPQGCVRSNNGLHSSVSRKAALMAVTEAFTDFARGFLETAQDDFHGSPFETYLEEVTLNIDSAIADATFAVDHDREANRADAWRDERIADMGGMNISPEPMKYFCGICGNEKTESQMSMRERDCCIMCELETMEPVSTGWTTTVIVGLIVAYGLGWPLITWVLS